MKCVVNLCEREGYNKRRDQYGNGIWYTHFSLEVNGENREISRMEGRLPELWVPRVHFFTVGETTYQSGIVISSSQHREGVLTGSLEELRQLIGKEEPESVLEYFMEEPISEEAKPITTHGILYAIAVTVLSIKQIEGEKFINDKQYNPDLIVRIMEILPKPLCANEYDVSSEHELRVF